MSTTGHLPTVRAPLVSARYRPGRTRSLAVALVMVTSLAACGRGGAASGPAAPTPPTSSEIAVPSTGPSTPEGPVVSVGTRRGTLDQLSVATLEPAALRLPSIDVDAVIRPVGVERNGEMEVPIASEVGWYRFGPTPGAAGSAVLAAHVDFDGERGAFFELRSLAPGDPVEVTMADGTVQQYRVEAVEQVPKGDLSASGVFDRAGPARLALVTCGGTFDEAARSYRDNVVAYAVPIRPG